MTRTDLILRNVNVDFDPSFLHLKQWFTSTRRVILSKTPTAVMNFKIQNQNIGENEINSRQAAAHVGGHDGSLRANSCAEQVVASIKAACIHYAYMRYARRRRPSCMHACMLHAPISTSRPRRWNILGTGRSAFSTPTTNCFGDGAG